MEIFADIFGGFNTLFSDQYAIWFVFLAAIVGIVFGALPGLTAAAAIAMMLPILIVYNDEIGGLPVTSDYNRPGDHKVRFTKKIKM